MIFSVLLMCDWPGSLGKVQAAYVITEDRRVSLVQPPPLTCAGDFRKCHRKCSNVPWTGGPQTSFFCFKHSFVNDSLIIIHFRASITNVWCSSPEHQNAYLQTWSTPHRSTILQSNYTKSSIPNVSDGVKKNSNSFLGFWWILCYHCVLFS